MVCGLVKVDRTDLLFCHVIAAGTTNVIVGPEAEMFVTFKPELLPSHHLLSGLVPSEN